MEVVILAGGLGTRLRPVVDEVPKCMAPVAGKPFLEHLLDSLLPFDVSRVVLSVGYLREAVISWVGENGSRYPFGIDFAVEEEPLGTGGGIALALAGCSGDDVLVLNGDTFFNIDLDAFYQEHLNSGAPVSLALKPMRGFDRYGTVTLAAPPHSRSGVVAGFREKEYCSVGLINGGIYAIRREGAFPEGLSGRFSFEKDVLARLAPEGKVHGFVNDCWFIDIGIPSDYSRCQTALPELETVMGLARRSWEGYDTLFLDRDGVINRQIRGDYVRSWDEFEFMPGVPEAIALLSAKFARIIVVTNQRGVGRGLMSEESLEKIHVEMVRKLAEAGGHIDKVYCCTSSDIFDPCRKPNPGMFLQACCDFPQIRPESSVMIGDSASDMEFAAACGMKGILIEHKS